MIMSNKLYDVLKAIGRYVLPYGTEISATIMAVDVFLNAVLGISSYNYNKENK